ncbi:MAG: phage tail assembly chaperone [Desulfobacteraceae bacterium]|nr:phage tail assembly chaperone [Desulfobacteraceae bacterium]
MGYFAVVDMATGQVGKIVFHGDGSVPEPEDGCMLIETDAPAFANPGSRLAYKNGELVIVPNEPSKEEAWAELRQKRNILLSSTDWTQGVDVPETIKSAFVAYRQALRDLPTNTTDPLNPVWPTAPAV